MNKIWLTLPALIGLVNLGACATDGDERDADEQKVYVTGSNIPRHIRPGEVSTADKDAVVDAIRTGMPDGARSFNKTP